MPTSAASGKPLCNWKGWTIPARKGASSCDGNRRSLRFELTLPVRYRTAEDAGWGELLNISCCGALFTTERPLELRSHVELRVKWPVMLSNSANLNLVVAGKIVRVEEGRAALRIQRYEFRTCSPSYFAGTGEPNILRTGLRLQVQVANNAVQGIGM